MTIAENRAEDAAGCDLAKAPPDCPVCAGIAEWYDGRPGYNGYLARCTACGMSYRPDVQAYADVETPMTDAARKKVIGHALDHVAYGWAGNGLPVRHDGRKWTREETRLYYKTYREAAGGRTEKA